MALSFRRFVGRVAVGALAVAVPVVLTPPAAASAATPTDLLISEYIEGSSNNKALEIFNGTGPPSTSPPAATASRCTSTGDHGRPHVNLTGTVATGDVFVAGARRRERDDPRAGGPDQRRRLVQR